MKTIAELEQDILQVSMKIRQDYPELSKYIKEIPLKISAKDKDLINIKNLTEYYDSLVNIIAEYSTTHEKIEEKNAPEDITFSGYPLYPPSEDVYSLTEKEMPLKHKKASTEEVESMNEKGFNEDMSGDDLDIPGTELDDQQEIIGNEDEENNYYSLGGDGHNDLDEN